MNRVSTGSAAVLALLMLLGAVTYAQTQPWPLKRTIDLSSGFGDFRPNRFHAGVDLRTGGAVGAEVVSPVNGYIMKVRMSYRGYGKGLYIRGDDRHIYVLGHLDRFADPLETAVRVRQFQRERYYVEIDFPTDSIRVKQGQLVAYAGKTGIGAPHLHFEKRTPDNVPIDPLSHGFVLDDTTPPTFERIGFHLLDDRSLFSNGRRKVFYPVRRVGATEYVLDTVLYLNAPFGVLAHCYDQMREGGMRQAVKKLTLTVDGEVLYESDLDSLPFESGSLVNLDYDLAEASRDEKRVRNLFRTSGKDTRGKPFVSQSGLIGSPETLSRGLHTGVVTAGDGRDNTSHLTFKFAVGSGELYELDTCAGNDCYFSPLSTMQSAKLGTVRVEEYRNHRWSAVANIECSTLDNGWLKVTLPSETEHATYRLVFVTESGAVGYSRAFNSLNLRDGDNPDLNFALVEGGLALTVGWKAHTIDLTPISLYCYDRLQAELTSRRTSASSAQVAFVPAKACFQCITGIRATVPHQLGSSTVIDRPVSIAAIGFEVDELLGLDDKFSIRAGRDYLFEPSYISLDTVESPIPVEGQSASRLYRVQPETFPVRKEFRVSIKLDPTKANNKQTGLCWYDNLEKEWVWIDDETNDDNLAAGPTLGGGLFAAIVDSDAPKLTDLNLKRGHRYWNRQPQVTFKLEDNLSGFEDDRSLDVRIDGQWLLPEFDIEDGDVVATLREPLALGNHVLIVSAVDRAGNRVERRVEFEVIRKSN